MAFCTGSLARAFLSEVNRRFAFAARKNDYILGNVVVFPDGVAPEDQAVALSTCPFSFARRSRLRCFAGWPAKSNRIRASRRSGSVGSKSPQRVELAPTKMPASSSAVELSECCKHGFAVGSSQELASHR